MHHIRHCDGPLFCFSFVCEIFLNPVLADLDIQVDVDDLDNLATPEMIMLSAVSGEGAQDR